MIYPPCPDCGQVWCRCAVEDLSPGALDLGSVACAEAFEHGRTQTQLASARDAARLLADEARSLRECRSENVRLTHEVQYLEGLLALTRRVLLNSHTTEEM